MNLFDTRRFEDLHIVRKIRDQVRKWWRIEIAYADAAGMVVDHTKGIVIPPQNSICRAVLADRDGFAACNRSVEEACRLVGSDNTPRARVVDTCHLGFPLVFCPIVDDNKYYGSIFTGGFLVRGMEERRLPILGKASAIGIDFPSFDDAYRDMPVLEPKDLEYLCDLMETTAEEILVFGRTLREQEERVRALTQELGGRYKFGNIVGKSAAMQSLFAILEKVVDSNSTVLIQGENGTGKELIARALHYSGPRREKPCVVQNCSALNDNLLESELFGHMRGSFTGASKDKKGLFEVADGGTFFLDEVGDMSTAMQVKLLRVIQEGTFLPVGSVSTKSVDVRIVAATNRDLKAMIAKGQFREDLYYRLNVINLRVPALRERIDDLPLLVEHFFQRFAKGALRPKRLVPQAMARLYAYRWPGNIRELENEIERLVVLSGEREELGIEFLSPGIAAVDDSQRFDAYRGAGNLEAIVAAVEKEMIHHGLIATHWNKTKLATQLGVSRTTLIKKIRDYGLEEKPRSRVRV